MDVTSESMVTNANAGDDIFLAAWRSVSLALLEYRSGHYARAADLCQQCLNYPEYIAPRTATAHTILALSNQRLGKTQAARSELGLAREIIDTKFKNELDRGTPIQGFWFDWVFAQILLKEAKRPDRIPCPFPPPPSCTCS